MCKLGHGENMNETPSPAPSGGGGEISAITRQALNSVSDEQSSRHTLAEWENKLENHIGSLMDKSLDMEIQKALACPFGDGKNSAIGPHENDDLCVMKYSNNRYVMESWGLPVY